MSTRLHERVYDRIAPLVPTLLEQFPKAITEAEAAAAGLGLPARYQATRVHVARACLRHRLSVADLGGWEMDEFHFTNAAIRLVSDDVVLRFLHSNSVIPAPGRNRARRAWYTNMPLVDDETLFSEPERLLLVWGANFKAGTASIEVVHPTRPWDYGHRAQIDLSIPIDDIEDFTSAGFDTRDEEEDLPMPSREEAAEGATEDASA